MKFNELKKKIKESFYQWITRQYIRLSNERHQNNAPAVGVREKFRSMKFGYANSIESVYFSLLAVYGKWGTSVIKNFRGYKTETTPAGTIVLYLYCERPGLFIGKNGRDVDAFQAEIEKYFGLKTEVKIVEEKNYFIDTYRRFY